jgi:UDP-N-acetylglucosamine acyltransferase
MAVHATSVVEKGARLGADVEIGPFCVVGGDVVLGDGVRLLSHVVLAGRTDLGSRTVVYPHCVLGEGAQIRGARAPDAKLIIGEDCVLREGVTMSCGSERGGGLTAVGANGYFMANSHVGHDCRVGEGVTFSNGVLLGGHVEVGEGVVIGGNTAVQQFSRIGRGAMISGLSGVALDIIPYGEAVGLHARHGGLNIIGLKRRGLPRSSIHILRAAYRMIFLERDCSFAQAAQRVLERWPSVNEVREIAEFILAPAKRQIAPARNSVDKD